MQRMLALEKALSLGHWAVLGRPINGLWAGFLTQWPNWADPNGPAHGPCTGLLTGLLFNSRLHSPTFVCLSFISSISPFNLPRLLLTI
jgi:hypothetical protein